MHGKTACLAQGNVLLGVSMGIGQRGHADRTDVAGTAERAARPAMSVTTTRVLASSRVCACVSVPPSHIKPADHMWVLATRCASGELQLYCNQLPRHGTFGPRH